MGQWLERLARRAAASAAPGPAGTPPTGRSADPRTSRRDFLKKAGVVGAAAWSVPVIESALAPASAASTPTCVGVCGGACPTCGLGQGPCTTNTQCSTGLVCSSGVCKTAQGGTCSTNSNCSTGVCIGGTCRGTVAGTPCSGGTTCLSYICSGGTCHQSAAGFYCLSSADCYTSGGCSATAHTCNKSAKNGKCLWNGDCTSNNCQGAVLGTLTYGTCK